MTTSLKKTIFIWLILFTFIISGCQSTSAVKNIKVGISAGHSPWEELNSEGNQNGISIDFITAYESKYNVKVETVWLESSELQNALESNQVDCILSSVPASETLFNQFSLSDPYTKTFSVMLYNLKSPAISKGMLNSEHVSIAVLEGSYEERLARSQFSNAEIQRFKSRDDAVKSLLNAQSDVMLDDAVSALNLYIINQSKINLNPAPLSDQYQYYVVIANKDQTSLTAHWNTLFKELRTTGFYDTLYEKYMTPLNTYIDALNLQIEF